MEFETEFDYISLYSGSDSVSEEVPIEEPIDESLIIQAGDGEEEFASSPDAIEIGNDSNVLFPELESWESLENNNDQVSDKETLQNETLQVPEQIDGETLSNIYKLLDERIPEQKTGESESESESELESEVSLKEIKTVLENIENYESEQLSAISTISDNIINSINNDYHFSMYEIGLLSALIGSLAISALFRKIL